MQQPNMGQPNMGQPNMGQPIQPGRPTMAPGGQMGLPMAAGIEPAGFWIRFIATIIDGIIVAIPQYAILIPLGMVSTSPDSAAVQNPGMTMLITYGLAFAVAAGYYGYFYTTKGASLGKLALNIRVVNANTGTKLTWGQAILRETIGKMISGVLLAVGYLMAAFRSDKRALHDLMVGSQCLRKK